MIRASVRTECVRDVEAAVGKLFAALDRETPDGIAMPRPSCPTV
jgi:hypothetical protein